MNFKCIQAPHIASHHITSYFISIHKRHKTKLTISQTAIALCHHPIYLFIYKIYKYINLNTNCRQHSAEIRFLPFLVSLHSNFNRFSHLIVVVIMLNLFEIYTTHSRNSCRVGTIAFILFKEMYLPF